MVMARVRQNGESSLINSVTRVELRVRAFETEQRRTDGDI